MYLRSKVYLFTDVFEGIYLNDFILVTCFLYEKQSGFRVVLEKKVILKIYIESLKTACEGVSFSLKFQVRNLQLY